jgi:hypothetical protein
VVRGIVEAARSLTLAADAFEVAATQYVSRQYIL